MLKQEVVAKAEVEFGAFAWVDSLWIYFLFKDTKI